VVQNIVNNLIFLFYRGDTKCALLYMADACLAKCKNEWLLISNEQESIFNVLNSIEDNNSEKDCQRSC
jgi:hypothetical protein